MHPQDAGKALREVEERLAAAVTPLPVDGLLRAAQKVAHQIRLQASRAGHPVAVRVVERGNGVRLTVRGPAAAKYRRMAEQELARLAPESQAEVRTQITRKLK